MASADTIALIVAGSGEVSDKEVFDLIEDWAGGVGESEITLIVPVTKNEYTDAVNAAVEWYLTDEDVSEKDVMTVKVEGSNLSRKTSALGDGDPEVVENFGDIFKDDFEGFNEVYFFVALAKDADGDFLTEEVEWLEAAEASKVKVVIRNLAAGLDDVILTEPEEAVEPEPEPEAKPARRSRRKAAEPEEELVKEKSLVDPEEAPKPARKSRASRAADKVDETPTEGPVLPDFDEVTSTVNAAREYFRLVDQSLAVYTGEPFTPRNLTSRLGTALETLERWGKAITTAEEPEAAQPSETESETPSRGRGRPRTNFEERQIWDEDKDDWIKPGRGRLAKGTEWRVIDTRDGSVLDEGTA